MLEKRRRRESKALPFGKFLQLCRYGFFPSKDELYRFTRYDRALYVTDQQMLMTAYINGQHAIVLNDKVLFAHAVGPFVHVPKNFAFVDKRCLISLVPEIKDWSDIKALLIREKLLIVKPICGLGGKGIQLLHYDGRDFLSNGRKRPWREMINELSTAGDVIICEYIRQGEFANRLYPHTVNTIRMLSMRHPESNTSFIAAAAFRIGCSRSLPVDNLSAGGLVCDIDMASGRLGKAATGFFCYGRFHWLEMHPDTGLRMEGLVIVGWDRFCRKIEEVANQFPYLPYIAWDVALGYDEIVVIEGNAWTDVSIFQIYRPLLLNDRIGAFLKYYHII